jgi:hypothetical protein
MSYSSRFAKNEEADSVGNCDWQQVVTFRMAFKLSIFMLKTPIFRDSGNIIGPRRVL